MIFLWLTIEKSCHYSHKIHNYSTISDKLLDVTTVSLVLALSHVSLLDIELIYFGNQPRRLWFMSKNFWNKTWTFCKLKFFAKIVCALH